MTGRAFGPAVRWMFTDRRTGRIVIAQAPNALLAVWIVAVVVRAVIRPHGAVDRTLALISAVALAIWCADEMVRGVNPWRRLLGTGVLAALIVSLAR